MTTASRLTRLRWGVRTVLALGVAASVTANVLHARPDPISQTIAGWPPIALLLTVELISRIPVHRRGLATVRIVATALIAGIAAWVSYWHMAGVAARYGESGASAYLLPLSVDGLIVVASVCLVELGAHLATTGPDTSHTRQAATNHSPDTTAIPSAAPNPNADHTTAALPPARTRAGQQRSPASAAAVPTEPAAGQAPTAPGKQKSPKATTRTPRALSIGTTATQAASPPPPVYTPTNHDDTTMYRTWLNGVSQGQEPSGADLARAAGRTNDAAGIGRRAARRYRNAHAKHPHTAPPPTPTKTSPCGTTATNLTGIGV